jgi:hypothetical protein
MFSITTLLHTLLEHLAVKQKPSLQQFTYKTGPFFFNLYQILPFRRHFILPKGTCVKLAQAHDVTQTSAIVRFFCIGGRCDGR